MRKKLLAIIATAAMVVTMIPSMAFAATEVTDLAGLQKAIADGKTEITITKAIKISSGDVTLKDAEGVTIETAVTDVFEVSNGATLTLGSGITVDSSNSILYANGGTINVEGAILNSTGSINALGVAWNGGTINVKSGEVNSYNSKLVTLGAKHTGSTINISGGKVTSNASSVLNAREYGTINISGDAFVKTTSTDIDRNVAAYTNENGKITISGGKVESTTGKSAVCADGGIVEISGGTITGKDSAVTHHEDKGGTVTITGGTFSSDVSAYFDTTKLEQDDNGNVVAKGSNAPATTQTPEKSPNTGDNSMAPFAVAGLVMAAMAAVVATRRRYN